MNDVIMILSLTQAFNPDWQTVPVGELVWSYNDWDFSLEQGEHFGRPRYFLDLRAVPADRMRQQDWESLLQSVLQAYNRLHQRYPLYFLLKDDQLEIIRDLSRVGAFPYLGEWADKEKEESEQDWITITENLRAFS